jgi:hypothetical protein
MNTTTPRERQRLVGGLWVLVTLLSMIFVPIGRLLANDLSFELRGVWAQLSWLSLLAFVLAMKLHVISASLAIASAVTLWRKPQAGAIVVLAQLVAFLGVCAVIAWGFLEPFQCMCHGSELDELGFRDVFRGVF